MTKYTLLIVMLAGICSFAGAADANKPNIVVIVADDLGYADVLFNPQHPPEITTPHLDALAEQAVICRQGYVSGHVCSPTRAGLMMGRYQQRLGLYTGGEAGSGLPMSEKIFPQYLQPAGYVSGQIGKWHLGPTPEWSPALRGFDEVFGFLGRGAHDYFKLNDPEDPIYRGLTPVELSGYLTDRWGDEAVSFIERHKSQPFFLYLAFNAVHAPLQAPADEIAKFDTGNSDRNTLLAMGKRMDDAIGAVVDQLKATGTWDNTLLFFISDNGGPLPNSSDNTPLRGGKHQDYEGGVRVPFLVCWPNQLQPGESQAVVSSLDILPTAMAAAGVAPPTDKPLDGMNILPVLQGKTPPPSRDLFWSSGAEERWWAVRSGDWKLVGEKGAVSLFDLNKDLSEENDLAEQRPEKVAALTALHDSWIAEMAYPIHGGAKREGLPSPDGSTGRKSKKGRAKPGKAPKSSQTSSGPVGHLQEPFTALPKKPWIASRGNWTVRDSALWGAVESSDAQPVLRRPAEFSSGVLQCDLNLPANGHMNVRFKDPAGAVIIRVDLTTTSATVVKRIDDRNETLQKIPLKLTPDAWHTLMLSFDGPELHGKLNDADWVVTDAIFEHDKGGFDFLIFDGPIGFREFSLKSTDAPVSK